MKYIDAEKLKAEIERRITDNIFGAKLELIDILAWLDTISEEPDKSLEEAAIEYATDTIPLTDEVYTDARIKASFIAGAEWQKGQMMDEWLKDRDGCFWDGVEEGKKAMEKQMLKDAVEGEIVRDIHNLLHVKSDVLPMPTKHKFGDKVKIIILPDETDND